MRSFAVLSSLALAGLSAAQFQGLPACAIECANQFFSGGIGNCGTDAKCICSNESFIGDIACCLAKPGGCDTAAQSSAVVFASSVCNAQGISVPTAVSCASTGSGNTTGSSTEATKTGESSKTTGGAGSTGSGSGSGAAETAKNTAATGGSQTTSTPNWAPRPTAMAGGVVGGVMAVVAML